MFGHFSDLPDYSFDKAKAAELLNQAGYGPGKKALNLSLTYTVSKNVKFTMGGTNIFNVHPTRQDPNETDNGFKYESVQFGLNGASYFARLHVRF